MGLNRVVGGSWVGGSWVMGGRWSWVVGGGSCLFEDKKSAQSKFVLGLVCFENFQSLIKKR